MGRLGTHSTVEHPPERKNTRLKLHAIVSRTEEPGMIQKLVQHVPVHRVLDMRGEAPGSPRIAPAGAIDVNFERAQIKGHLLYPKSKKGAASEPPLYDLAIRIVSGDSA